MEVNLRNVLIVISAVVIIAILLHGLWTIRKNKNPYKLKTNKEKPSADSRGFDSSGFDKSGFDQDGVSKPRVISENTLNDNEIPSEAAPAPSFDAEPLPKDIEKPSDNTFSLEPKLGNLSDIAEAPPVASAPPLEKSTELAPDLDNDDLLAVNHHSNEDIKSTEKSVSCEPKKSHKRGVKKKISDTLKRNQMEINFGSSDIDTNDKAPTISDLEQNQSKTKPAIEPEVIVVSVVMPENMTMSGAALLPTLLTLGLRFGDMDIFHRHQDNAGNGKVTFSLANMMNPGVFDLDQMESFTTQGVSLFMTLPNAGDAFAVFEQLMTAAKQLSMEFGAQLLDDKRSVMTKQTEQHYMGKIREFERKNRIALAQ
jgi:cell division protein ZipA